MINVGELRVGSIVCCDDQYLTIECINKESNSYIVKGLISHIVKSDIGREVIWGKSKPIPIEDIYPINLAEEILLKCGFEKLIFLGEYHYVHGDVGLIRKDNGYNYGYVRTSISETTNNIEPVNVIQISSNGINYLHQLQNLYFSLTGEELKVSL